MLLLCFECHKIIDDGRAKDTVAKLRLWKKDRNNFIRQKFSQPFESFNQLKETVLPILERNYQIFKTYGPLNQDLRDSDRHNLWLMFEPELISNNAKIETLLGKNKELFHKGYQDKVDKFVAHAREFIETRVNSIPRINLFPDELLSIFGIEEVISDKPVHNVAALQNFVSYLIKENRFISLQLEPEQLLKYEEEGITCTLDLRDLPRVEQIFWTGQFYRPRTTALRLESLVFLLEWLQRNGIGYQFQDYAKLTEIILNNRYRVKLFYIYCLSVSDLHEISFDPGSILINLHNWNGMNCISGEARGYAGEIGVKLFSQNDFFVFAHKEIK